MAFVFEMKWRICVREVSRARLIPERADGGGGRSLVGGKPVLGEFRRNGLRNRTCAGQRRPNMRTNTNSASKTLAYVAAKIKTQQASIRIIGEQFVGHT